MQIKKRKIWTKAKNCCVYGSDRYYANCTLEGLVNVLYQYASIVTITAFADIYNVSIAGNYADAYLKITSCQVLFENKLSN